MDIGKDRISKSAKDIITMDACVVDMIIFLFKNGINCNAKDKEYSPLFKSI